MKRLVVLLAIVTSTLAAAARADTVLGLYAGLQVWDAGASGGFASDDAVADFDFDGETTVSVRAALEHPLPFIPNLRVVHTGLESDGEAVLAADLRLGGTTFAAGTPVRGAIDLTQVDAILYYELLDSDSASLDLGVNLKYLDGSLDAVTVAGAPVALTAREDFTGVVPLPYARVALGLPFSGLGAMAEASALAIGDHSLVDAQVGLTWEFLDTLAVDAEVQAGWRVLRVELEDLDGVTTDVEFDGAFVGVRVHF